MLLCLYKCRQACREAFVITLSTLSELMAKSKNHESTLPPQNLVKTMKSLQRNQNMMHSFL